MLALQIKFICCLNAARLTGRFRGVPVTVSAFADWSASWFSWIPTCAAHLTRAILVVGESDMSFRGESTALLLNFRPGVFLSGWDSAQINVWLFIKNQKLVCSLVR